MKNFREKLKKLVIDNVLAMIISIIGIIVSCLLMENGILPNLKNLWFIILFISFAVLMYNITALIKIDNLGKRMYNDYLHLKNKDEK